MNLRLVLASLLVVVSVAGCKKKKSDPTADQGSGTAATASGSADTTPPPPPAGSGSVTGSGTATGSGCAAGSASAVIPGRKGAVDPSVVAKLAAIKADSLIDASGKPEVPVKGSIQDYVTALAHANGAGTATATSMSCPSPAGRCVEIEGDPCPAGAPEDCEGMGITLVVDADTGVLAAATIAGEAVDPKLLGDKKALRKAIDDAYSEAP